MRGVIVRRIRKNMTKKNYPMPWPVDGVCDMCDYFLGEKKGDGAYGHCGWDGTKYLEDGDNGDGLCGANTKIKI